MKQVLFTLYLLIIFSASVCAQHQEEIKSSYANVQKLAATDVETFDPELVIKYTYPPLVEMMGGKDQYLQVIQSAMEMGDDYEEEDEYYEDEDDSESITELAKIGEVYNTGEELQAVVEIHDIEIYSEDYQEVFKRYQLAISRDGGSFWYFVDGTLDWNKVVPNLHKAIVQPQND